MDIQQPDIEGITRVDGTRVLKVQDQEGCKIRCIFKRHIYEGGQPKVILALPDSVIDAQIKRLWAFL